MKAIIRIATGQYEFVEIQLDEWENPAQVREIRDTYAQVFRDELGLPDKEFNTLIDAYLTTKTVVNGQEEYEHMNAAQKNVIQSIKRSFKRTNK